MVDVCESIWQSRLVQRTNGWCARARRCVFIAWTRRVVLALWHIVLTRARLLVVPTKRVSYEWDAGFRFPVTLVAQHPVRAVDGCRNRGKHTTRMRLPEKDTAVKLLRRVRAKNQAPFQRVLRTLVLEYT